MKKCAFSVWPGFENNPIPEKLKEIRKDSSLVLENAGFSVYLVTNYESFDEASSLLLLNKKQTSRWFAGWSDYVRLVEIEKQLLAGNQVMYFDYDLIILRAPTGYGCALETHLESEDKPENIVKYWFRGVNCTYNLLPEHLDIFREHLDMVRSHIIDSEGKVNFTYPMNYLAPIEEKIGYVPNYFLFGSLDEPLFCSEEKVIDCVEMYASLTGIQDKRIDAVNAMGSRVGKEDDSNSTFQFDTYHELNRKLENKRWTRESTKELFKKIKNCRIRPNYGSHKQRNLLKRKIKECNSPSLF